MSNTDNCNIQLEPLSELFKTGSLLRSVLKELLIDHATRKNIVWATDTYKEYGSYYEAEKQMFPDFNLNLIERDILCPRVLKAKIVQKERTKKKAEVFTPSWVCCMLNNYCDDEYFGEKDVFAIIDQDNKTWARNGKQITFPNKIDRWHDRLSFSRSYQYYA